MGNFSRKWQFLRKYFISRRVLEFQAISNSIANIITQFSLAVTRASFQKELLFSLGKVFDAMPVEAQNPAPLHIFPRTRPTI